MDFPLLCKGDVIKIENIYYDYNKSDIRPDAAVELDKVVAILNKYPKMTIELRSHTDSRGKDAYNEKLSDSRAKSATQYINSQGIDIARLKAKGYGEKELLNKCTNGVECDDKMHEENRRTEFKILSL
jgi:outer membrane protein OmpA-like peptidoglycan-associated protein